MRVLVLGGYGFFGSRIVTLLAVPLKRISEWFLPFGTDTGAMSVHVRPV